MPRLHAICASRIDANFAPGAGCMQGAVCAQQPRGAMAQGHAVAAWVCRGAAGWERYFCVVLLHGPAGHPLGVWDLYSRNVNEYLLEVP